MRGGGSGRRALTLNLSDRRSGVYEFGISKGEEIAKMEQTENNFPFFSLSTKERPGSPGRLPASVFGSGEINRVAIDVRYTIQRCF